MVRDRQNADEHADRLRARGVPIRPVPGAASRANGSQPAKSKGDREYTSPAGRRLTSDKPLKPRQLRDLDREISHARKLHANGNAGPGDTVQTTRVNGRRVSSKVVPGPASGPKPPAPLRPAPAPRTPKGAAAPRTPAATRPAPNPRIRPGRA
jgi:hypothetical protein